MSRQPGDSIPSCILVLKGFLELFKEVIPGSKGYDSTGDHVFPKGISPSQSRPFGHVQEGKCNFLRICVVECLVHYEVELDGVHPRDGCFIGAIKGFGFAKLKLSRFG